MTRATSGTPLVNFSGAGFWIAVLLIIFLPAPVLKAIVRVMDKP